MSSDARITDLNPDGSKTGRVLAINPSGHLVGIPESVTELKPGFRFATAADVALKQKQAKAAADKEAGGPAPAPKPDAK